MPQESNHAAAWWGDYTLDLGHPLTWEIGRQRIQVVRLAHEWQVVCEKLEQEIDEWHFEPDARPLDDSLPRHRVVFRETHPNLHVAPRLADRPVVSRPSLPFSVPPGEQATLFLSSPLWAHLQVHDPLVSLHEVALQRPSDTWFGPTTGDTGEYCYASRTQGRLALEDVPRRMYRAITRSW